MRAYELRGKQPDELRRQLRNLQEQLTEFKMSWQTEENPDTNEKRKIKRDIARIKTVLREMEEQEAEE
jgi:large subunit ribosomal protein L29